MAGEASMTIILQQKEGGEALIFSTEQGQIFKIPRQGKDIVRIITNFQPLSSPSRFLYL